MKTLIIIILLFFLFTGPVFGQNKSKTTYFYSPTGQKIGKSVETGNKLTWYSEKGERIAYGEATKNGVVIYETKGKRILGAKGNGK